MINQNKNDNRRRDERAATPVRKKGNWLKPLSVAFITCVFALLLVMPMLYADDLEIGPEIIGQPMGQINVKAPTVDPVLYDATTISGGNLAKARINKKNVIATVHVTLKGEDGTVKATLSVTPKRGTTWKVDLPSGVKVAKGDTATVYQQIGEDKSPEVTAKAQPSKASTVTLTMPSGEIWIEQTSANIVNEDEQAEAVQLLKDANAAIAGDIKSVKFSIDGTEHAYYEVTYKDNSTTGKVEAPNLKIKKVTETSRSPEIGTITIVDNVVKGKLPGPGPFDGIKVQLILNVNKGKSDQYCNENKCKVDKDSSNPIEVKVQSDGSFSYTLQAGESLTLDQIVGVSVKEPHKFVSCSTTTVKPVTVGKTEVRDPRKLTSEDKKTIDAAIRKAYTVNGVSKLPNGTASGMEGIPAVIQIDDSGNVKIFSGNDVAGNFDSSYNFVPEKNEDGSYKVKDGAEPIITIPAKDLLKNIAPKSPVIAVDTDAGKVTITPPAYKDPGDDTDLASYTITYKDASGADKTVTVTRTVDDDGKTTWTADGATVDATTGTVTLEIKDIEVGGTIISKAKDKGGLEGDEAELESDPVSETLETIKVTYDANGGSGTMEEKKFNKGSGESYTILENKFTPPANQEFDYWEVNGEKKKAGDPITIGKDDVKIKAIWKDQPTPDKPSKPEEPEVKKPEKINGYYPFRPYFLAGKNACQMVRDWGEDDVKEMLDQFNAHANWYKENHVPDVDQIAEHINMHGYELLAKEYNNEYGTLSFRFGKPVTLAEWKNLLNKDSTFKARFADPAEQAIDQVDEAGNKVMVHNKTYYVPIYIDYKPKTYKVYWDIVPNKTSIEQAMGYWPGRDINEEYDRLVGGSPFNADLWAIHHIGKPDPCKPNNQVAFPLPDYRTHDKAGLWFYAPAVAPKAVKVKGSNPIKYKVTFEYIFAGTETYQKYYRK